MSRMIYFDHLGNEIDAPKSDVIKTNATNGDRIRAMTDEKLINRLSLLVCVHLFDDKVKCEGDGCRKCWSKWLKQEAT